MHSLQARKTLDRFSRLILGVTVFALVAACTTTEVLSPEKPPASALRDTRVQSAKTRFVRPSTGEIITRYDSTRSKGIDIAGHAGDPVVAAADGRVVYVGDQLRGYGQMVIIKHDETFLTAYAHNQSILVKENDVVAQNQEIARMGQSDAERVKLHFEIRKNGIAVNPEPYLEGRSR